MALVMVVGISPGDFVLDGDPSDLYHTGSRPPPLRIRPSVPQNSSQTHANKRNVER